jgi:hypothetical protein
LGAKTDTQYFFAGGDAVAYQCFFRGHPGMAVIIIGPHGAAHDHQYIKLAGVREWVTLKQQRLADGGVALPEPGVHGP